VQLKEVVKTFDPSPYGFTMRRVEAIDKMVLKFRRQGVEVELLGLNEASSTLLRKLVAHSRI
jgi:MFS superfamily sulfate permease-like transporter